jgi:hypothetical protein
MQAVNLGIICRVADDEDALGRQNVGEPIEEPRCSHASCERDHGAAAHR